MKSLLAIFTKDNEDIIKQLKDNNFNINVLETKAGIIPEGYQLCFIFFKNNQEDFLKNILNHYNFHKEQCDLVASIYQKIKNTNFNIPIMMMNDICTNK